MVKKGTTLTRIKRYIEEEKLQQMKPWSHRTNNDLKSGYMNRCIRDVRFILNILSGGEIVDMLTAVLNVKERDRLTSEKYKTVLTNLSEHYNKTPVKQRHNIVRPFKSAAFKHTEVRRLGFATGRQLWKTCINKNERKHGGRRSISDGLKNSINEYLKDKSRIASNRLTVMKDPNNVQYKEKVPARYLDDSISELWKTFPLQNNLKRMTFYKYVRKSGTFKRPIRVTDLCEYCEEGIQLRKKIIESLKDNNYLVQEPYDFEQILGYVQEKAHDLQNQHSTLMDETSLEPVKKALENATQTIEILEDYLAVLFHKQIATTQRLAYNQHRKSVEILRGKILIEMDYKEKIVVGLSPRQVNREYYEQTTRSCLGFGIYYVDKNNEIQLINIDIISSDLKQDADATIRGWKYLRQQEFFKNVDQKHYIVWSDCGKHFRCSKVISYLLDELASEGVHVNVNFFCEKHGKSSRDAHFSNVSRFINDESLILKIESSKDIADAIEKRQRLSNENKTKEKQVITYAIVLDDIKRRGVDETKLPTRIKTLQIENCYNYRTVGENYKILTSVLSLNEDLSHVQTRIDSDDEADHIYNTQDENVAKLAPFDFRTLNLKKIRLRMLLQKIKNKALGNKKVISTGFNETFLNNNTSLTLDENTKDTDDTVDTITLFKKLNLYCQKSGTKNKPSCTDCKALCNYSIRDILHPTKRIGQHDILEELKSHQHPKCRKIEGRQRRTGEAASELAAHYIYAHNNKEPILDILDLIK